LLWIMLTIHLHCMLAPKLRLKCLLKEDKVNW
jgi:hypothetical protein